MKFDDIFCIRSHPPPTSNCERRCNGKRAVRRMQSETIACQCHSGNGKSRQPESRFFGRIAPAQSELITNFKVRPNYLVMPRVRRVFRFLLPSTQQLNYLRNAHAKLFIIASLAAVIGSGARSYSTYGSGTRKHTSHHRTARSTSSYRWHKIAV